MQSAKCWAPPSRRSSRSTEVITTYLSFRSAMAMARLCGSLTSSGFGRPWPTSQNGQRRVQMSPMIMKVAVPPEKHSPRFGQDASSQTLCSLCLRSKALMRSTSGETGIRTRIQSGLRGNSSVGIIFTGIRATFSAPRNLTPTSIFTGAFTGDCASVLICFCPYAGTGPSAEIARATHNLWRGSLLPLGCGAAPLFPKKKGTAAQSNGSKLPRHRFSVRFDCFGSVAINREVTAHRSGLAGDGCLDVGIAKVIEDVADPASQFDALGFLETTAGDRRCADAQARGHERRLWIVGHGVFVHGDPGAAEGGVGVFAGQALADQADQEQVVIGATGHHVVATVNEDLSHRLGVADHLRLIGLERRLQRFFEAHGFGRDDVHQREIGR